ncbi:SAM-dependent methyltransferase [Engelhardtia mirabilis]|uniref:Cyclopropane-fatty-acyl-phospholipid synthase n=1 Tax=Engelhardtia mirabilis TaxID=2528011 RepID=A0A518BR66_9BACT|nr:Cyclopropane-fatty-acyl-phospholipid synthase [Planctomycetes bacterium Pla133]QDV03792.1 Cyclopropane-fatty-acyl-phospholipid synthase [Planctomycetes bacterium Pla86]
MPRPTTTDLTRRRHGSTPVRPVARPVPIADEPAAATAAGELARSKGLTALLRRAVVGRLEALTWGQVELVDALGVRLFGSISDDAPRVRVEVLDPDFYWAVALRGSVGVGEAYGRGHWRCEDLVGLVRIFARNRQALEGLEGGLARFSMPLLRLIHAANRNHRDGARANIAAHYDLGNALYERMLDPTLMYSSGIYRYPESTLYEASVEKLDAICRKLDLGPEDHVVEIGTGWGGFAEHAAARYGCRVTTTTISKAQFDHATERMRRAGLTDRVEVLLEDYRDLSGTYTKLVSIEMVEAIGADQYPTYLGAISRLLAPDGLALVQAITIADQLYDQARREVDFIKRHIFPGCCIPSVTALVDAMASSSDLRLAHLEDLTPHYARTLADWRANFAAHADGLRELGYDDEFQRLWQWYLAYSQGGFMERVIQDVQLVFAKPLDRRPPIRTASVARP